MEMFSNFIRRLFPFEFSPYITLLTSQHRILYLKQVSVYMKLSYWCDILKGISCIIIEMDLK